VHTEFGFKADWVSGPGKNVDPTFAINQAKEGKLPKLQPDGTAGEMQSIGATPEVTNIDPNLVASGMLQFYTLSSRVHRVVMQPQGFDGICETLDQAEQWADWNWMNPFGSLMADFKPWLIRAGFASVAAIVILIILYEQIKTPLNAVASKAGNIGLRAAVPELNAVPLPQAPQGAAK
jgi:hypothetical protein